MGEPGGLPSMGSHRVGHDLSDLAAAAATDQTTRMNTNNSSPKVRLSHSSQPQHIQFPLPGVPSPFSPSQASVPSSPAIFVIRTHFSGYSRNVPPLRKPASYPKWSFSSSSLPPILCICLLSQRLLASLCLYLTEGSKSRACLLVSFQLQPGDSMLPIVGYQQMPTQNTDHRRNEHATPCMQWL